MKKVNIVRKKLWIEKKIWFARYKLVIVNQKAKIGRKSKLQETNSELWDKLTIVG